jgi:hypothetical protein
MRIVTSIALTPLVWRVEQISLESHLVILVAAETERRGAVDEQILPVAGMRHVAAEAFPFHHGNVARLQSRDSAHVVMAPVTEFLTRRTQQVIVPR